MGVVDSAGKDRLILNGMYLNLFLEALPFRYEKLRDILAFTKHGSYMASWDLKSGYFHVPIHPAYWKYFGFRIGGVIFYFKVLPFGFAQACYVFTKVMQEPVFELRKRGIPLSSYIDDAYTAADTFCRCARQSSLSAIFMGALGVFRGLPKCNLTPEQLLKWLGFLIDTQEKLFKVGPAKLEKLKAALADLMSNPSTSARGLARIAGRIISTGPAIAPAALYRRSLFQAMKGSITWDQIFPTSELVKETAQFWLLNLERFNGRRWWPRPVSIKVKVDASGVGFGGILTEGGRELPFKGTFSESQAEGSSTARETRGYAAALVVAAQEFPSELHEASVLLKGDNQGAISALNQFRSPVSEINEVLKGVFELCAEFKADVIGRWIPRENLTEADALSREPDPNDWGISKEIYEEACSIAGVSPVVDLFASDVHHTTSQFVSHFFTPGCCAVDAIRLDWSGLIPKGQVAWVFPPSKYVSTAISLAERYKIEMLLCLSIRQGSNEMIQIRQLREAKVSQILAVPKKASSCTPSGRVPSNSLNPAFLELGIMHIAWTDK
jgi:hypothetical protein